MVGKHEDPEQLEELLDRVARELAVRLTLMLSELPREDPAYFPLREADRRRLKKSVE